MLGILVIMLSCPTFAATIHGSVYDLNLEKMNDVIVNINTEPKQMFVVKNGTYSFNVPEGNYVIQAYYKSDTIQKAEENISIKTDGTYTLDLILFPSLQEEEDLLQGTNLNIDEQYFQKTNYTPWIVGGIILVLILISLILIIVLHGGRVNKKSKENDKTVEKDELHHLIDFIKKQGGRTTQKDIRKEFPSSEAKISLMITELEQKGKIEKIKKGRGNIIILKN